VLKLSFLTISENKLNCAPRHTRNTRGIPLVESKQPSPLQKSVTDRFENSQEDVAGTMPAAPEERGSACMRPLPICKIYGSAALSLIHLAPLGIAEVENRVAVQILHVHRRALPQEELDYPLVPLRSRVRWASASRPRLRSRNISRLRRVGEVLVVM